MRIIIGGANSISRSIVGYLSRGNNDIVVIDDNEQALNDMAKQWDIMPIHGLVSHPDVLQKAGAGNSDLLIAATESDEVNMVACQAAYTLFDIPRKIARIASRVYFRAAWGGLFNDASLPVDLVVSPEYEIAKAIMNIIKIPGMSTVYSLGDKKVCLLSFRINKKCPLVQIPLNSLGKKAPELEIAIVSIVRGGKIIYPCGSDVLHGGDEISLLVEEAKTEDVVHYFGLEHKANEKVIIIGGNSVAMYLAERLETDDNIVSCKIIDDNPKSASYLAEHLERTDVFNGSIMNESILEEVGIATADASVAVSSEDKDNLVASMVAKKNGVENTIALVTERSANTQIINIGENILVDKTAITMSTILKELRLVNLEKAYSLGGVIGEVWEVLIRENSPLINSAISQIQLPAESWVCVLVHKDEVFFELAGKNVEAGDRLIIFCSPSAIRKAEKVFL